MAWPEGYASLKASDEYKNYTALTRKLQGIDLNSLKKHELKGFLINIYNCLCIHGLVEDMLSSFPGGTLSRLQFYAKTSYIIGSTIFSLNDIENGLYGIIKQVQRRGQSLHFLQVTRGSFCVESATQGFTSR